MKVEREHGDNYQLPADAGQCPPPSDIIASKDTEYVQGRHGVVDYPVSPHEFFSRGAYDFLDEERGTVAVGADHLIDFGRIVKMIRIQVQAEGQAAPVLYVNFNDAPAAIANGSIQVRLTDIEREFFISVRRIHLTAGVSTATYRVTWGY